MRTRRGTSDKRPKKPNHVGLSPFFPDSIPASIRKSPLMKEGGFQIFQGVIDARIRNAMLSEAMGLLPSGTACEVSIPDNEEVRGGKPRRSFINSQGGPVQHAFYSAPWLLDFLRGLSHNRLTPTGALGTYSYYIRPGDFLETHRDILECDIAVISCLSEGPMDNGDGGRLCLYPERLFERLSSIRATPDQGAVKVRLDPGQTIVLYGGIVPHGLRKVAAGQARIVSVLCYRAT